MDPQSKDNGMEHAMVVASRKCQLSTIQYIYDLTGDIELMRRALDEAIGHPTWWLYALYKVCNDCGTFRAVKEAIELCFQRTRDEFSRIKFLIRICPNNSVEDAIDYAKFIRAQRIVDALEAWDITAEESIDLKSSYFHESSCRIWDEPFEHGETTWPELAVRTGDLEMLQLLDHIQQIPAYSADSKFQFESAARKAIEFGQLFCLKWLLNSKLMAVKSTFLDVALFYHELEIAIWLAEHFPEGCQTFGSCSIFQKNKHLGPTLEILEWVEEHDKIHALVDYGAMACYAAEKGDLLLVQKLFECYPFDVMARNDILDRIVTNGNLIIVKYLHSIGYRHCSTMAIDGAACGGYADVVQFLLSHYTNECTPTAVVGVVMKLDISLLKILLNTIDETIIDETIQSLSKKVVHMNPASVFLKLHRIQPQIFELIST